MPKAKATRKKRTRKPPKKFEEKFFSRCPNGHTINKDNRVEIVSLREGTDSYGYYCQLICSECKDELVRESVMVEVKPLIDIVL